MPAMTEQSGLELAGVLRQLRAAARLTQEELAEAAGVSPRSVSDLERGINRTARKDTALLLADALNLTGPVRTALVGVARGRAPPEEDYSAAMASHELALALARDAGDRSPRPFPS